MSSFVPAPPGPCPFYHITPGRDCNCILCKHFMTGSSEILDGSYGLPRQGCALPRNDGHGTDLVIARSASDVAIRLSKLQKDPPVSRGVHKTVNGAYRCGCAPFLYANMTYGTVAGSPPWLSLWESQVPRVMHYTERCIEVRPCYLFDKLKFSNAKGNILYTPN